MTDEPILDGWPAADIVAVSRELTAIARTAGAARMAVSAGGLRWEFEAVLSAPPATAPQQDAAQPSALALPATARTPAGYHVCAPLVGVYYAAPAPGAEPLVAVGDRVKVGQPVAIIEAMKLMNEVVADRDGVVREIHCSDGEVVEYGQVLVSVDVPTAG